MVDEIFANPRLAPIYDPADPDRSDLNSYADSFSLDEVRDAPDRPGREFVFIARSNHRDN